MHQSYRYAIFYFTLFALLLLLSGAALFVSKLGISYTSVADFYLGNRATFSQAKTFEGLLETVLAHLGAMGLFIFVAGHFLLFGGQKKKRKARAVIIPLFIAAAIDIGSGFCIIEGYGFFIYLKIVAFLTLQLLGMYLLLLLFLALYEAS